MRRALAVLWLVTAGGLAVAAAGSAGAPRPELATIRADLEGARFEAVVAAATSLLARPDLPASDVVEALALRSQARVSLGQLAKAEDDWKRLLALNPAYAPDPLGTGRKALERFDKVQRAVVGSVRFVLDPPDAAVAIDGQPLSVPVDGIVALAAGSRRLSIASPGFDPANLGVDVVAGAVTPVEVRLVPNARRIVIATDLEGVEVRSGGRLLGRTRREGGDAAPIGSPASLALDPLPLGDHVFELRKECYRTTRIEIVVSVDVLDRSPIQVAAAPLAPARSAVTFSGGVPGAEILWGGEVVATLPTDGPVSLCAGARELEARAAGRAVWRGTVDLPEEGETLLEISPRPNAAIVGSDRWPDDLASLASSFGMTAGIPRPSGADLATASGWRAVTLPPDTDLAIAVVPAQGATPGLQRVYVFSPWLGTVTAVVAPAAPVARPAWRRPSLGWRLSDSELAGGVVVAATAPEGPAASAGLVPGERLIAIGGRGVGSVSEARARLDAIAAGAPIDVTVVPFDEGPTREVKIVSTASPVVREPPEFGPLERAILAAYAAVDGAGAPGAPAANATLGAMLISDGRAEQAVAVLSRARFASRPGVGDGTVAYLLGRALTAAGREAEARDAFRKARQSSATAFADDGPEVAPAAADHLADLGVTAR